MWPQRSQKYNNPVEIFPMLVCPAKRNDFERIYVHSYTPQWHLSFSLLSIPATIATKVHGTERRASLTLDEMPPKFGSRMPFALSQHLRLWSYSQFWGRCSFITVLYICYAFWPQERLSCDDITRFPPTTELCLHILYFFSYFSNAFNRVDHFLSKNAVLMIRFIVFAGAGRTSRINPLRSKSRISLPDPLVTRTFQASYLGLVPDAVSRET